LHIFNMASAAWCCDVCTYNNQQSSNMCEMCGTPKPDVNGTKNDGWQCVLCTFFNPISISACQVCGAPSPLTQDLSGKQICGQCTMVNNAERVTCSVCGQPFTQSANGQDVDDDDDDDDNQQATDANNIQGMMDVDPPSNAQLPFNPFNHPINNQASNATHIPQPPQYANPFAAPAPPPLHPSANAGDNIAFGGFSFGSGAAPDVDNGSPFMNHSVPAVKQRHSHKHKAHKHKQHGHHHTHPQSNIEPSNTKETFFKDVEEIFANDANDEERIQREQVEVKQLGDWYSHIYLLKKKQFDVNKIRHIITSMMAFIPQEHLDELSKKQHQDSNEQKEQDWTACQVCFCDFDDSDQGKLIVMSGHCTHALICKSCFVQHLSIKIKDDDITPWIACPAPDCKAPVCCELLFAYLDVAQLYQFAQAFIRKHLARNGNWIKCHTKQCEFGWIVTDTNVSKKHRLKCSACNKKHTVCKDPMESDQAFNELIKSGVLRQCPKCKLPTIKDKGMCNIIHCGKCGMHWNWKTRETGTSSSMLKNKARVNGTLWEPGELAYQQQLQRSNLPEFIKLLERNGIKYDANYVRGTR